MSVYLTIHNNSRYGNTCLEFHNSYRETGRIALISSSEETNCLIDSTHQQSYKLIKSDHKKKGVRVLIIAGTSAHLHAYAEDFQAVNTITVEHDGSALLNDRTPVASVSVLLYDYVNGIGSITTPNLAAYLERKLNGDSECVLF